MTLRSSGCDFRVRAADQRGGSLRGERADPPSPEAALGSPGFTEAEDGCIYFNYPSNGSLFPDWIWDQEKNGGQREALQISQEGP